MKWVYKGNKGYQWRLPSNVECVKRERLGYTIHMYYSDGGSYLHHRSESVDSIMSGDVLDMDINNNMAKA